MAAPTVFVSSTFYDLRYVREGLKRFVDSLGYIPILSEEGTVFYDPATTAAESCLTEVLNADLFVLIIGGRYGSKLPDGRSITNAEYEAARKNGIPIFALVEQGTYNDYSLYRANAHDSDLVGQITFPHSDSPEIFHFIERIQGQVVNNALVPFRTYGDVESYLRLQWAGMLHQFLRQRVDEARVADNLNFLAQINERIEVMTTQILRSVGTPMDRLNVSFLQLMLTSVAVTDLRYIAADPRPGDILRNEHLMQCAEALGQKFTVIAERDEDYEEVSISSDGRIDPERFTQSAENYQELRKYMLNQLEQQNISVEQFLTYESELSPQATSLGKTI